MISLNGVVLDDNLFIEGEFSTPARAWNVRQTMGAGGRTIIQETVTSVDRQLVLASRAIDGGFLGFWTRDQLEGVRTLEQSGAVVTLVVEARSWQVKVVPGGISVDPINPRPNVAAADKSIGSVTFIQV